MDTKNMANSQKTNICKSPLEIIESEYFNIFLDEYLQNNKKITCYKKDYFLNIYLNIFKSIDLIDSLEEKEYLDFIELISDGSFLRDLSLYARNRVKFSSNKQQKIDFFDNFNETNIIPLLVKEIYKKRLMTTLVNDKTNSNKQETSVEKITELDGKELYKVNFGEIKKHYFIVKDGEILKDFNILNDVYGGIDGDKLISIKIGAKAMYLSLNTLEYIGGEFSRIYEIQESIKGEKIFKANIGLKSMYVRICKGERNGEFIGSFKKLSGEVGTNNLSGEYVEIGKLEKHLNDDLIFFAKIDNNGNERYISVTTGMQLIEKI